MSISLTVRMRSEACGVRYNCICYSGTATVYTVGSDSVNVRVDLPSEFVCA